MIKILRKITTMEFRCVIKRNIGKIESIQSLEKLRKQVGKITRKPFPPDNEDCCGSGCVPCVFDVYEDNLKKWNLEQEAILSKIKEGEGHC